jgi:hypothetical protein
MNQRVTHKLPYKLEFVETEESLHAGQALDPEREIQEPDILDPSCDRLYPYTECVKMKNVQIGTNRMSARNCKEKIAKVDARSPELPPGAKEEKTNE